MIRRTQVFASLIDQIENLSDEPCNKDEKLQCICKLLADHVPHYAWVGFYLVDDSGKNLVLGPYEGAPTEHTKIAFGQGICGQAAEIEKTFLVQDVSAETNYLSCSPNVKSEIVVPIHKNDKIVGELDIDSHDLSPFTDEDQAFLEQVCRVVARVL